MNVRSLSNPIIPTESVKTGETRDVQLDVSSEDRDADGRRQDKEPDKNPLSEEEFKLAEEYFAKLTGLNSNGLSIKVESAEELRVFLIIDREGHVVRRILEWEMRSIIGDKDKKTGQLFDKSA